MGSKQLYKSLTDIAYEAGFKNLHDLAAHTNGLMGSVLSDNFEILYFKLLPPEGEKLPAVPDRIEIFAVKDQYDWDSCALYRFSTDQGGKRFISERTLLYLDNQEPLYTGQTAAKILMSYVSEQKSKE